MGGRAWQGGMHGRGHAWQGACAQERWPVKQTACILLECILVTTRKVCEGYVSTVSVCPQGGGAFGLCLGGSMSRRVSLSGGLCKM